MDNLQFLESLIMLIRNVEHTRKLDNLAGVFINFQLTCHIKYGMTDDDVRLLFKKCCDNYQQFLNETGMSTPPGSKVN